MALHAIVGQLYIIDGVEQDQQPVPGILAQPAPGRAVHGRQREVLFVHLTLTAPLADSANLLQALLQGISDRYFKSGGSVTAALRKAIQDTNNRLLQMNLRGSGPPREGAITCAVLRDGELYVVQTGESLALVGHNFGVERIPTSTPDHVTPLGRSAGLDFRYYHQRLLPADMLLLADPRITHLPTHALSPALVDTELEFGLEELKDAIGSDSGRLLLVEFSDESSGGIPVVAKPVIKNGRITLPKGGAPARTATAVVAQPIREGQTPPPRPTTSPTTSDEDMFELGDMVETTARLAAARSALGLSRSTGWFADLMLRLRPPRDDSETGTHWALPAILAILIPLIVAVIVSGVYLQRGRVRQVSELRQQMSQSLVLAQEADTDGNAARQHYLHLLELATEAEELRPGDPGVSEMRRQAVVALDQLDGVTRLIAVPFYTFDRSADLTAVSLRGDFNGGIYTLDGANGVVYAQETDESFSTLLSEKPETLGFGGQAVGSYVVQDLVDIMWRPRGAQLERDGLAMLDAGGALVTYFPASAETRAETLGLSSEWQSPVAMTQYSERIYVLDPASAAIWKYFPQDEGFIADPAERNLTMGVDIDLTNAVDIDLYSEDGSLLVAYGDGRLRYYDTRSGRVQWDETDLLQSGLLTPLVDPVTAKLVGKGLNASIFVLDAGNGRIIQISRLGNILAQYRATDDRGQDVFVGASDLAIGEAPLRLFVTVGNTLYLASQ